MSLFLTAPPPIRFANYARLGGRCQRFEWIDSKVFAGVDGVNSAPRQSNHDLLDEKLEKELLDKGVG